jgi:hypothetical protein
MQSVKKRANRIAAEYSGRPSPEELAAIAAELKARALGLPTTGWDVELAECERERVAKLWSELRGEKARQYQRRYKERHPERVRANRSIYQARWKAKLLGLPPPPLPVRQPPARSQPVPQGVEVDFDF